MAMNHFSLAVKRHPLFKSGETQKFCSAMAGLMSFLHLTVIMGKADYVYYGLQLPAVGGNNRKIASRSYL